MPTGRRTGWKTSSQRRRPTSSATTGAGINNNNRNGGSNNAARNNGASVVNHQYAKQLNPYKSNSNKLSSSLRGSRHSENNTDGVAAKRPSVEDLVGDVDDDDDDDDLLLGDVLGDTDDDDDDLGLDKILSSIAGDNANSGIGSGNIRIGGAPPKSGGGGGGGGGSNNTSSGSNYPPMPAGISSPGVAVADDILDDALSDDDDDNPMKDEKKESSSLFDTSPKRPQKIISNVNFGSNHRDTISPPPTDIPVSPVSSKGAEEEEEEDNDTLWSEGDATRQHKEMMAHMGQQRFASGFGDTTTPQGGGAVGELMIESSSSNTRGLPFSSPMHMNGPSFKATGYAAANATTTRSGSSLVDSIIDDISMPGETVTDAVGRHDEIMTASGQEPKKDNNSLRANNKPSSALSPPRGGGRFSSSKTTNNSRINHQRGGGGAQLSSRLVTTKKQPPVDPSVSKPLLDAPTHTTAPSRKFPSDHHNNDKNKRSNSVNDHNSNAAQKPGVLGATIRPNNPEDETLSTVTDQTESPFIYTYKKASLDDDSVSVITSSLAGNSSSMGSSALQNVPAATLSSRSSSNRSSNGLSWMNAPNNNNGLGASGGRGMIHRNRAGAGGLAISGPYGRDRGRKSAGGAKPAPVSSRGSNSGSNSVGSSGSKNSYEGGKSALDEIAYSLNADNCAVPGSSGRKNSSRPGTTGAQHRRPPQARAQQQQHAHFSNNNNEDLSTVESSTYANGAGADMHVDTNVKSNVSRLGMGGVSCAPQHISSSTQSLGDANSAMSDSSTSTMGFFQSLSLMAWRAQHHAGRFFFPTSPAVTRRKKFDRSDSMDDFTEDILLEEGANTLPHRKGRSSGRSVGSGHGDEDEEEEEIDYFSRAMSISNGNLHNTTTSTTKRPKARKTKYCWQSGTARIGMLFFLFTLAFTYRRMPQERKERYVEAINGGRGGKFRSYNSVSQVLDLEQSNGQMMITDAMVDAAPPGGRGRLGQPPPKMEELMMEEEDPPVMSNFNKEELDALPQQVQDTIDEVLANGHVQLPPKFESLANVEDLLFQRGIDVPFYWHVPRSAGGTMNDVLGSCLHLTLAADAGASGGHGQEETLKIIHFSKQVSYVNVDTSTHQGIVRAKDLNLISSGLADVVISPLLHDASTLFTPTRRGRMFTIFRHPVERAASLFYFIQETQWKQPATRNDQFAEISIEQFYKNGFAENNWMTRFLTNELTKGELTEDDLTLAKEVLRQKCLMGLLEEKGETFERIQKYFGWRPKSDEERECLEKKLEVNWPMKHKHAEIEEGSKAWRLIVKANSLDLRLYEYSKELFAQQGRELFPQYSFVGES